MTCNVPLRLIIVLIISPYVGESGFQNQGIFCLYESGLREKFVLESGILGFGIRNTAQGIRNPTDDWNPKSKCVTYSIVDLLDNLPGQTSNLTLI